MIRDQQDCFKCREEDCAVNRLNKLFILYSQGKASQQTVGQQNDPRSQEERDVRLTHCMRETAKSGSGSRNGFALFSPTLRLLLRLSSSLSPASHARLSPLYPSQRFRSVKLNSALRLLFPSIECPSPVLTRECESQIEIVCVISFRGRKVG